jgi:hypothetical protein
MQRIVVAKWAAGSGTLSPDSKSRQTGIPAASAWRMRSRLDGDALPLQIKVRNERTPPGDGTSGVRSSHPR